jgi:hypothetical protein
MWTCRCVFIQRWSCQIHATLECGAMESARFINNGRMTVHVLNSGFTHTLQGTRGGRGSLADLAWTHASFWTHHAPRWTCTHVSFDHHGSFHPSLIVLFWPPPRLILPSPRGSFLTSEGLICPPAHFDLTEWAHYGFTITVSAITILTSLCCSPRFPLTVCFDSYGRHTLPLDFNCGLKFYFNHFARHLLHFDFTHGFTVIPYSLRRFHLIFNGFIWLQLRFFSFDFSPFAYLISL